MIADTSVFEFLGVYHSRGWDVGVAGITLGTVERQPDFKASARLRLTMKYQSPPMGGRNTASDREAQPGAPLATGRGEGLKDGCLLGLWYAGAVVDYGEHRFLPLPIHRGFDADLSAARRGGFEGVEHQIEQGLVHRCCIEGHLRQGLACYLKPHSSLFKGGPLQGHDVLDQCGK